MFSIPSIWSWLTAQANAHRRFVIVLTWMIALVPAFFLALTVARYGVEVPALDDWEMAPLIAKAHTGELRWVDLFAQQQEARTVVPKLIFILSAMNGHWDVRDQMMLSVGLCFLTSAGIYFLLQRSGLALGTTAICFWLIVLLIFSPAQFELWLLASGFPSFMPAFCLMAALVALEMGWSLGGKFALCAGLSVLSTFTLPHGLLAWGLTFPVHLLAHRNARWKRWAAAWLIITLASAGLYFYGYKKPADLPQFGPALPWVAYLHFFLAFLGGEFAYANKGGHVTLAIGTGAVVLTLFVLAAVYTVFRWRDSDWRRRALPWLAVGFYSLGSATLTTLGRVSYGVPYAISSRYVTFALYATVAVIVLLAMIGSELVRKRGPLSLRATVIVSCLLLTVAGLELYRAASFRTFRFLRSMSVRSSLARSAILFSPVLDTADVIRRYNYPAAPEAISRAAMLDRLNLIRPRLIQTTQIATLAHESADGRVAAGACENLTAIEGERLRASGWATLPRQGRTADGVVLAYQTTEKDWTAFALSDEVVWRRDIVRQSHSDDFIWAGWTATFLRSAVPAGARISAWAIQADLPKLYQLEQKAILEGPSQ